MTVTTTEDNLTATATATTAEDRAQAGLGADRGLPATDRATLVEEDLLVEDVSIDGMCGVY
jgi:mycofactocin precursor